MIEIHVSLDNSPFVILTIQMSGAFEGRLSMTESNPRYEIAAAQIRDGGLEIRWGDGHSSFFHAVWLRHQCTCPSCGTPVNALRGIRLHHLPDDLPFAIQAYTADGLVITWTYDGHASQYASTWLRDHCYSATEREHRQHRPSLWDYRIGNDIPTADMIACEQSPAVRLEMLEMVLGLGFCHIANVPTDASEAHRLINLVGQQRQSHYGTYMLSKKGAVDNVGDVCDALDPHCDETYRLSTIGMTVFQVLRPSSNGGYSTLVDGFEAVERLRNAYPKDFDLLTKIPIKGARRDTAHNSAGNVKWYEATMPAIRIDFDGNVTGIRFNERQIMPLDLPSDLIEPAYLALKRLYRILYDPELRLTLELGAGEGLIFDNQRILHGRTGFTPEEPARSVLTSSVDIEEFQSSLRLLQENIRGVAPAVRMRQGMVT